VAPAEHPIIVCAVLAGMVPCVQQMWMSVYWGLTAAMPMQHATTLKGATPAPATLDTRVMDSTAQVRLN